MRGLHSQVSELRKQVFVEVARIAYESDNIKDDIEAIPYKLSPTEEPKFRESIYRERAVSSERTRLAMGMSIRPQDNRCILQADYSTVPLMKFTMNHL